MAQFDGSDAGCIADGSFGHEHVRTRLVQLLLCLPRSAEAARAPLITALESDMSDDAAEEDDAIDLLNAHCEQAHFEMVDGDLICIDDSE